MAHEKVWDDVHFYSNDLKIAAHLYTPNDFSPGDPPRPAIIVLHGYSGMKDVYGMDVPRWLWEAGYFVLSADYPGFGVSEGARGRHRPMEQADMTYDAVTYLQTLDGVDANRIAYYGSSWGRRQCDLVRRVRRARQGNRLRRHGLRRRALDAHGAPAARMGGVQGAGRGGGSQARGEWREDHDGAARTHAHRPAHAVGDPAGPRQGPPLCSRIRPRECGGVLALQAPNGWRTASRRARY